MRKGQKQSVSSRKKIGLASKRTWSQKNHRLRMTKLHSDRMKDPALKLKERIRSKLRSYTKVLTYRALHARMIKQYGKATKCEEVSCLGECKTFDWALRHGKKYKFDRSNFIEMCRKCHMKYDRHYKLRKDMGFNKPR